MKTKSCRVARVWIVCVASAVLIACGVPDPELEGLAAEGPSGRILFVANDEIVLWDGGFRTVLADVDPDPDDNDPVVPRSPAWAPDGERFAYVEKHDGYSDLVVANAGGTNRQRLTNNSPDADLYSLEYSCYAYWAFDPTWASTGNELLWVSDKDGIEDPICSPDHVRVDPLALWYSEDVTRDQSVYSYVLDASVEIRYPHENPTLSPTGDQVAVTVRTEEGMEILIIDLERGSDDIATLTTLVAPPDGAYDPVWSPDGRAIAYVQRNSEANDIWIAPVDGSTPYMLAPAGQSVSPVWSPDGRYLAFIRPVAGEFEVAYVEISESDGRLVASEPQRLFAAAGIDAPSGPSWSAR